MMQKCTYRENMDEVRKGEVEANHTDEGHAGLQL